MAVRVCILEDERPEAERLQSFLTRFGQENDVAFEVTVCDNAIALLERYRPVYDIIYMDIQMPLMNGMDAARRLRRLDDRVLLVFVTSLAQYALEGYEVSAQDYMVKPVSYYDFAMKLTRTLDRLPAQSLPDVLIATEAGTRRVHIRDVYYVEVSDHYLIYHTAEGDFRQYGTMSCMEKQLRPHGFSRCNSCYLVNLAHVWQICGSSVLLSCGTLQISRSRRKPFLADWTAHTRRESTL